MRPSDLRTSRYKKDTRAKAVLTKVAAIYGAFDAATCSCLSVGMLAVVESR